MTKHPTLRSESILEALRLNEREARRWGAFDFAAACQEYAYQYEIYGRLPVDERGRTYGRSRELKQC